jgi:hypothetical protein
LSGLDQRDERDRHVEKPLREPREPIETLFRRGIQNAQRTQRGEPLFLVGGVWQKAASGFRMCGGDNDSGLDDG